MPIRVSVIEGPMTSVQAADVPGRRQSPKAFPGPCGVYIYWTTDTDPTPAIEAALKKVHAMRGRRAG